MSIDADLEAEVAAEVQGQTIPRLLRRNAADFGELPALTSLDDPDAATLTWADYRQQVAELSRGLAELGLGERDRMLIMASSRPEHWLIDQAAVHLRAIPCTTYATLSADQVRFVAGHSAAPVAVLEGADQLERWRRALDELPGLRHVVMLDDAAMPAGDDRFVSYAQLRERGRARHAAEPAAFERDADAARPEDPISMIYTSGTTGDPKGVVLSHRNVIHEAISSRRAHDAPMHQRNIAYLPLAHIAERELSIYMPIVSAGHTHTLADPSAVVSALGRVRPQTFFGVPRVWEKMVASLANMAESAPAERRQALSESNELLRSGFRIRGAGSEVPGDLAERIAEADRQVMAPVRQLLGFDELTMPVSGAAALGEETLHFLAGLGIEIREVWGLSETTGAVTANTAEHFRAGTVGRPMPGLRVRVAEDGELEVRGPVVFLGYLQPDGSIADATDADGWFATGDIGSIDDDGFVRITDRKKELIITSSGKNVAPTHLEGLLKESPLIGQAAAIGDKRPYLTALIVLDDEIAPAWAAARGIEAGPGELLADHPEIRAEIDRAVKSANDRLARAEQIKDYRVVREPWTPETGEVTPTLKLKRRVIDDRYADTIAQLYR